MVWLLICATFLYAAPQPDDHTVLLLHLDEGEGVRCVDGSRQGLEARLDEAPRRPTWAPGRFGGCLRFDGANADTDGDGKGEADGLLVMGEGKLAQSGALTVEMWINPKRLQARQTLCALNGMNGRYTFFLDGGAFEIWMAFTEDGGERVYRNLRTAPVIQANTWQHVAFTYDGETMRALLNAVEIGRLPVTLKRYRSDAMAVTTIGRDGDLRPVPSGIRGFKGLIDEVRISDIARNAFDVAPALTARTRETLERLESENRFLRPYPDPEPKPVHERDVTVTGTVTLDGRPYPGAQVSDGEVVILSDSEGRYSLTFHVAENRYVCVTRPTGTRPTGPWAVLIDAAGKRTDYQVDFALSGDPASARADFEFLQTSDSQFATPVDMALIREDYAQMTSMTGQPAFLVCPGDLTMRGTHYELDMYHEICTAAQIDLYNVFGGHDGNYAAPKYSVANYQRKIGPTHFAWNYGGVHFMAWVTEMHYLSQEARQRQERWIEADLAAQPPGTPLFFVTHIPHDRNKIAQWLDKGYNIIGGLFGHWHAITQNGFRGIPFLNCSPIRGGDWGALTRAFRINTIQDGRLVGSEVRPTGQYQRLELICFAAEADSFPGPIRVLAFDSACRVKSLRMNVGGPELPGDFARELALERIGQWTWGLEGADLQTPPGRYDIALQAVDDRGRQWRESSQLTINPQAGPGDIRKGDDWPSLLGTPHGMRAVTQNLAPPLRIVWVANTGGRGQMAVSPIVHDGRVYVGVQTHEVGWRGAGVSCHDAATGEKRWFAALDSSVRFAPAVVDGVLVAVSHQGVVYGLDPTTGRRLWTRDLYPEPPSNIYRSLNKPVVACGKSALVARDSSRAVLLDAKTGEPGMQYAGAAGIYYAFPTAGEDRVFFGSRAQCEAYDRASGERLWHAVAATGKATSAPIAWDGRVYLNASNLHCYALADGELIWKQPMSVGSNAVAAPVFYRDLVIANGASLRAFDQVSGEPAWEFSYPGPDDEHNRRQRMGGMSAPVVTGDVLYAGSENGRLYALDAATGKELWSYNLGLPVKSWPAVSGNALYLSDYDGNLWAFVSDER